MDFTGKVVGLVQDFASHKYRITFEVNEAAAIKEHFDKISTVPVLDVKAVKHRNKRSLDANKYSWVLISKIADVMKMSKEEIYELMLIDYGQPLTDDSGLAVVVTLLSTVDTKKLEFHFKAIDTIYINGDAYVQYLIMRGQSTYNTKEMSIFIDGLVSEAKELGIETLTPAEIERMKKDWNQFYNKKKNVSSAGETETQTD